MGRNQLRLGTTLAAGALVTGGLMLAPAAAVDPTTATATYDCGSYGNGEATLTATQDGTDATISMTAAVPAPVDLAENSITSTLLLENSDGTTVEFSGAANPAMEAGDNVSSGPLDGTVAPGDSLDSFLPGPDEASLTLEVLGVTVTCDATSEQTPGPFVFD